MNIKEQIIQMKKDKIQEIEEWKEELRQDIENAQKEIDECNSDITKLEMDIHKIQDMEEKDLGRPSITLREGEMGLTKKQVEDANKWIIQHEEEKHKEHFYGLKSKGYQGAIGCAHYEISWGITSIGYLADITCTDCKCNYSLGEA